MDLRFPLLVVSVTVTGEQLALKEKLIITYFAEFLETHSVAVNKLKPQYRTIWSTAHVPVTQTTTASVLRSSPSVAAFIAPPPPSPAKR